MPKFCRFLLNRAEIYLRRKLSPPNIYLRRIFISAEYLSPPEIIYQKLSFNSIFHVFHTMELHLPNSTVKLK